MLKAIKILKGRLRELKGASKIVDMRNSQERFDKPIAYIEEALKELEELENRSCDNCSFDYQCSIRDSIIQGHEAKGLDISKYFITNPFYCNRYTKVKEN